MPSLRRGGDHGLALIQRELFRLAVFGDSCVLLPIGNVGAVPPLQYLNPGIRKILDDTFDIGDLLFFDELQRPFETDSVGVVTANRNVLAAVSNIWPKATDACRYRLAVGSFTQIPRQLEQIQAVLQRDIVHLLTGSQPGKEGFLLIISRADLNEGAVPAHTDTHRSPALRVCT